MSTSTTRDPLDGQLHNVTLIYTRQKPWAKCEVQQRRAQTGPAVKRYTVGESIPNASVFIPAVEPDVFFRAGLSLCVTGSPEKPKDVIEKWVRGSAAQQSVFTLNMLNRSRLLKGERGSGGE